MAQVAVNWVSNRPAVASVLVCTTKLAQLQDNLVALDFTIPPARLSRLDAVSAPSVPFRFSFFGDGMQGMINGGAPVGDKPASYHAPVPVGAKGTGVGAKVKTSA